MDIESIISSIQNNLFDKESLPKDLLFKPSIPFEYPPETDWERSIRENIGDWL